MKTGVYSFPEGKEPKDLEKQIKVLKKQLKIAVDILEVISTHTCIWDEDTKEQVSTVYNWSREALEQIEELVK
jgi:Tat protein secretion system quality control protein TatD with DNase activity